MVSAESTVSSDFGLLFRGLLSRQLQLTEDHEVAILTAGAADALHDFRVSVRRIRTLLSECQAWLSEPLLACRSELGWLGRATSPLRDGDVLLAAFPGWLTALSPEKSRSLLPLQQHLLDHNRSQARMLVDLLGGERYHSLKANLRQSLELGPSLLNAQGQRLTASSAVTEAVDRRFERVLRQGAAIHPGSADEELHELRKSAKKLRYLLEFFRDYFPSQKAHDRIAELKRLQDSLGRFQDLSVQAESLRDIVTRSAEADQISEPARITLEALLGDMRRQQTECRDEFSRRFKIFQQLVA